MSSAPPKLRIVARDGVASESELQRDAHGPAASTIAAFEYLVRQGDPARLEAWLARHPADEVVHLRKLLLEQQQCP
jgi:hypothetical protein